MILAFSNTSRGAAGVSDNTATTALCNCAAVAVSGIPLSMFSLAAISAFLIALSIRLSVLHEGHFTGVLELVGIFRGDPQPLQRKSRMVAVGAGATDADTGVVVVDSAGTVFPTTFAPQPEQKATPSWSFPPHPEQNMMTSFIFWIATAYRLLTCGQETVSPRNDEWGDISMPTMTNGGYFFSS
jgi:hypothetical protein